MPDDKSQVGEPDRSRVASNERYEIEYLAESTGITVDEARILVARFGNDREVLEREARKLRHH